MQLLDLEQIAHPQQQLGRTERFGQEIASAALERTSLCLLRGITGENQERHNRWATRHASQTVHHLKPVHPRHVQVEHDQIRAVLCEQPRHPRRFRGRPHPRVTGPLERSSQQQQIHFLVINEENPGTAQDRPPVKSRWGACRHRTDMAPVARSLDQAAIGRISRR